MKAGKSKWKSWIASVLTASLLISMMPVNVFAAENTNTVPTADPEESTLPEQTEEPLPFDKNEINKDGEIPSERTENTKLFYEGGRCL